MRWSSTRRCPATLSEPEAPEDFDVPAEADEADAAEQHMEIEDDDEESYR